MGTDAHTTAMLTREDIVSRHHVVHMDSAIICGRLFALCAATGHRSGATRGTGEDRDPLHHCARNRRLRGLLQASITLVYVPCLLPPSARWDRFTAVRAEHSDIQRLAPHIEPATRVSLPQAFVPV
jgi:hypothetical protein